MGSTLLRSCIWKRSPYFVDEGFVIVGRQGGPGVEGGVVDADLDVVLAGFEEFGDVEAVGRVPERAGGLAVDGDEGGLADGWVVVGVHAGAGAGDARDQAGHWGRGRRARAGSWGRRGGACRRRPRG